MKTHTNRPGVPLAALAVLCLALVFVSCPEPDNPVTNTDFVEVTMINGLPRNGTVGFPLELSGTVVPPEATRKSITWEITEVGGTQAQLNNGNTLTFRNPGTVTLKATITGGDVDEMDYIQPFSVNVKAFEKVTNIKNVPETVAATRPLTLSGTVEPSNATDRSITWTLKSSGGTGAAIDGNTLTASNEGTVTVTATIASGLANRIPYTWDFPITVTKLVPVTSIVFGQSSTSATRQLFLTGTALPADATNKAIRWSIEDPGATRASITGGNILNTEAAGTVTVMATITNGKGAGVDHAEPFTISVGSLVEVTNIVLSERTTQATRPLSLDTTVSPSNATNQAITWEIISEQGNTEASWGSGSVLNTKGEGKVILLAIIHNGRIATHPLGPDYTQEFEITVSALVPVTGINLTSYTATAGFPFALDAVVSPGNATNKAILWSINSAGTDEATKATITGGNMLSAEEAGTVRLSAKIANGTAAGTPYTKDDITITVQSPGDFEITSITFDPVADPLGSIVGVTDGGHVGGGTTSLSLSVASPEDYSSITWIVSGTGITGTGSPWILDLTKLSRPGYYSVTVKVIKNGVPYNQTIGFYAD